MHIGGIRLVAPLVHKTYAEVYAEYQANGYKAVNVEKQVFQAESETIEKMILR